MERTNDGHGFGLIELVVAIPLFLTTVAAVAIPNLLQSRLSANETNAFAALKSYATAQAVFMKGGYGIRAAGGGFGKEEIPGLPPPNPGAYDQEIRMYAYPYPDLYRVSATAATAAEPVALISRPFAEAHRPAGAWHGYWFLSLAMKAPNPNLFDLCATPAKYGASGRNTCHIDITGAIRQRDFGATVDAGGLENESPAKAPDRWIDA